MKDWLRDEIDTIRVRCARAERKLDRRLLDDKAKQEQRPRVWAALVEELQESVTHLNESIKLPSPLVFTEKDGRAAVAKNDHPKCRLNVEFRETSNDILFSFSPGDGPKGSIVFDVDDDGNVILLLGDTPQTIDDVAAMLLRPVFKCIC